MSSSRMSSGPKSEKRKVQRVVVEIDRALYLQLKSRLVLLDMTVRAWFERAARKEVEK